VQWSLQEGDIIATLNEAAQTEASRFDGCDVLETDVSPTLLEAQAGHDRYRDVHEVEQDFGTMQTGLLEVRPICVRQAPRTRAHVAEAGSFLLTAGNLVRCCSIRRATCARTRGMSSRPYSMAFWRGLKARISSVETPAS
jgi:hypothetical protein